MKDLTEILKDSNSKLIKSVIDGGGVIQGIKVEDFYGVLVDDKEFASALSKKLEAELGIKGYISTDELPRYGISKAEKETIEQTFECKEKDIVVFVADKKEKCEKALELIEKEVKSRKP